MSEPISIELLGRKHTVTLPDFATREEIMVAYGATMTKGGVAFLRVCAATLGLCSRVGREAGADYVQARCDVLVYGGKVYSYLREQGVTPQDIATLASPIIASLADANFPRAAEVETTEGN